MVNGQLALATCDHLRANQLGAEQMRSVRLSVIVPCFNEMATVAELLRRVRRSLPTAQIIVVDDGSTDGSLGAIREVEQSLALEVVCLDRNYGKGYAFRAGLELADREFVIIQDADLEYDPRDIPKLLSHAIENNSDAVYGSRYLAQGHRTGGAWRNYLAVLLLAKILKWRHRLQLSDPATCYKLFRRELLCEIKLGSNGFELCQELNRLVAERKWQIDEVAVSYEPRTIQQGKKIRAADFWRALMALLRAKSVVLSCLLLAASGLGCNLKLSAYGSAEQSNNAHGSSESKEMAARVVWDCGIVLPGETTTITFPFDVPSIRRSSDIDRIESSCECIEISVVEVQPTGDIQPYVAARISINRSSVGVSKHSQKLQIFVTFHLRGGENYATVVKTELI